LPGWIFDSVALIDWYCNRRGIAPYVEQVLSGESEGAFSTITELELWQGLRPAEEERHEALLSLLDRIPLDSSIARTAGKIRQHVGLDKLSLPDAAIAATAITTGRTLLTRNTKDFSVLRGTMVIEFYDNR
jgi:predicted nucleic acid-binding protein